MIQIQIRSDSEVYPVWLSFSCWLFVWVRFCPHWPSERKAVHAETMMQVKLTSHIRTSGRN